MNYAYDGTFFGFLSVIFDAYHDGISQVGIIHDDSQELLLAEDHTVSTDMKKAQRVLDGLQDKCGGKTCHYLYYAFLAEQANREDKLLRFIRLAFHYKKEFLNHLSEPDIWEVRQWARKAGNERHKLLGLLRFRELANGMLYAQISPDCDVVPVMAPHFVKRLTGEKWVIHDVKRAFGVYYDSHDLTIVQIPRTEQALALSSDEDAFAALWQKYYHTIAIRERTNHKLRRSYMPMKYWKYLIENP